LILVNTIIVISCFYAAIGYLIEILFTGFVKQKAYDPTRRMEALVTVPISQVAAQQRAGRAGRTAPGACYRLYSSDCYENFMGETIPEIMRSSLSNVILYLKVRSLLILYVILFIVVYFSASIFNYLNP
jgi:hypothetical protein